MKIKYEDEYLEAILESLQYYNLNARADIATWIYKFYQITPNIPNTNAIQANFIVELISKFVQIVEDILVFGMMFSGYLINDLRFPYEIFIDNNNKKILKFSKIAKKGLKKVDICKIMGLKTAEELKKEGKIELKDYLASKKFIDGSIKDAKKLFTMAAKVYCDRGKYSAFVQLYFNGKHGFKIIHKTEAALKVWPVLKEKKIDKLFTIHSLKFDKKNNLNAVRLMGIGKFDAKDVELLHHGIKQYTKFFKEYIHTKISSLKDPYWMLPILKEKIKDAKID